MGISDLNKMQPHESDRALGVSDDKAKTPVNESVAKSAVGFRQGDFSKADFAAFRNNMTEEDRRCFLRYARAINRDHFKAADKHWPDVANRLTRVTGGDEWMSNELEYVVAGIMQWKFSWPRMDCLDHFFGDVPFRKEVPV